MKVTYFCGEEDYTNNFKWSITVEEETETLGKTLEQIRGEIAKSFWSDPVELEKKVKELKEEYSYLSEQNRALKALFQENKTMARRQRRCR